VNTPPMPEIAETDWRAGTLALPLAVFTTDVTCGEVFERFAQNAEQVAAAIIDENGNVAGIVNRLRFLARYAQRYTPELFAKRSIITLANTNPLVVDENVSLVDLAKMLTLEWPDALRECFVVTREGRYLGIGTSEALVRAKLQMLTDREAQLRKALDAAYEASKAKGNFLALMSHELRTPLNAVIGLSEVLATELFGPHTIPRYREYSADIHGAGKHLLALINDILDLSKLEAGKLELYSEPLEIEAMFRTCVKLVSERAREQGVRVTIVVPNEFPLLNADHLRLKQILLNLLSNAVKFTHAGGRVVLSAVLQHDGAVVISVSDTGIGMDADSIPKALEPFRQIDSPLSRKVEGTGLGLSLVKTLAELHDGTLEIESKPDVGTKVSVHFPAWRTVSEEPARVRA
jgi:two-component system cell cycle sensor histidine kinase PleC